MNSAIELDSYRCRNYCAGIGLGIAMKFLSEGHDVVLVGRSLERLESAIPADFKAKGKHYFVAQDISTVSFPTSCRPFCSCRTSAACKRKRTSRTSVMLIHRAASISSFVLPVAAGRVQSSSQGRCKVPGWPAGRPCQQCRQVPPPSHITLVTLWQTSCSGPAVRLLPVIQPPTILMEDSS